MAKNKRAGTGGMQLPARKAVPVNATQRRALQPASGTFVVRWARFDFDGPWCLAQSDAATMLALMRRIKHFETMRPIDIFGTTKTYPGTDYEIDTLPNQDAIDRIAALNMGDETRVSAVRITGEQRFWGIRRDLEFYALFWDPEHNIWPTKLKHT